MSNGLVSVKNLEELQEMEERNDIVEQEQAITQLAGHIRKAWQKNRRHKDDINERLLRCLRARKGEYSSEEMSKILDQGGADPIYIKLTGTKSRAAAAWVRDVLLPPDDKPWSLAPTPIPELPPEMIEAVVQSSMQMPSSQEDPEGFQDKVKNNVLNLLKERSSASVRKMEIKIEDLQAQGGWNTCFEEFIEDLSTYPAAFIKGPYIKKEKTLSWGLNGEPKVVYETSVGWRRVSPFDIFPGPHSRCLQKGDLIERLRLTRGQLYDLKGLPGYSEEAIENVLDDYDFGHLEDWMWEDFERSYLETDGSFFRSDKDTIDALHYWGSVKGQILIDWGVSPSEIKDPLKNYEIDAILVNNHVIRAVINDHPLGQRPYHSASWDQVPSSIWGIALPEQMEDIQRMVNSTARALANNMALSSGPQAVVLTDQLAQGEDVTEMYPFKVWQMKSNLMTGGQSTPVSFFQPDMNAQPLLTVMQTFENKADEVTNVPRYSYGGAASGGAGISGKAFSMLLSSSAKGIRRAINHIDQNVIKPSIHQTFVHLMLNDPDPSIKSDVKIVPRGSAALLIKEQQQESRKEFLGMTANEIDMQIVGVEGRTQILKEVAKDLGMDIEKIFTQDPREQQLQQQMAMMQEEVSGQQAELMKEADRLRTRETEIINKMRRVAEQEVGIAQEQAMSEVKKAQDKLASDQIELSKRLVDLSAREENLKVVQKSVALDKEHSNLNVQKAQFEHLSGDFERRISDAESDATLAKIHRVVGEALNKLALAEQKLDMAFSKESEGMDDMEKESKKEDAKDEINAIRQEVMQQFAELVASLNKPKQITRDDEGRISGVVSGE